MRAYAVYQALRFVLMLAVLAILISLRKPGTTMPLLLTVGEAALTICLLPYASRLFHPTRPATWGRWLKVHAAFGGRALLSGVFTEANTRADVLMLGLFMSDRVVGIYSVAAFVAEGLFQLLVILRTNINPLLALHFHEGRTEDLLGLVRRGTHSFHWILGTLFVLTMPAYPLVSRVFMGGGEFMASWPAFCLLATGIIVPAGYLPFMMMLVQTGNPGPHTLLVLATVATNVVLNALLIPILGLLGAAIATGSALVLSVASLRFAVRRVTGLRI